MWQSRVCLYLLMAGVFLMGGCAASSSPKRIDFAIALHGGAGTIPRDAPEETQLAYRHALEAALAVGRDVLASGGTALDAVEATVVHLEDNPLFNAGRGGVFSNRGLVEMDAAIMDGATLKAGAVTGATTPRNPIRLARRVMENTPHVLLSGPGADLFAQTEGVDLEEQEYFHTERQFQRWQRAVERENVSTEAGEVDRGTVGAVALDRHGNLAVATSTGGLTNKRYGRVGDSPIIGAGTYANNATLAISCTGWGEMFLRHVVAHRVSTRMDFLGESLGDAMHHVFHETLDRGVGGAVAVDHAGNIVMEFNTRGMYRGAADSTGRFEVAIWGEE